MIGLAAKIGEQGFHFWLDCRGDRDPFDPETGPGDIGSIHCNTPTGKLYGNGRPETKHTERRPDSKFGKVFIERCWAAAMADDRKMIREWIAAANAKENARLAKAAVEHAIWLKQQAGPALYDALAKIAEAYLDAKTNHGGAVAVWIEANLAHEIRAAITLAEQGRPKADAA